MLISKSNFVGCWHRQIGRFTPLENPVDVVDGGPAGLIDVVGRVAHEAAGAHVIPEGVDRRQPALEGEIHDLRSVEVKETPERRHDECLCAFFASGLKRRCEIVRTSHLERLEV